MKEKQLDEEEAKVYKQIMEKQQEEQDRAVSLVFEVHP